MKIFLKMEIVQNKNIDFCILFAKYWTSNSWFVKSQIFFFFFFWKANFYYFSSLSYALESLQCATFSVYCLTQMNVTYLRRMEKWDWICLKWWTLLNMYQDSLAFMKNTTEVSFAGYDCTNTCKMAVSARFSQLFHYQTSHIIEKRRIIQPSSHLFYDCIFSVTLPAWQMYYLHAWKAFEVIYLRKGGEIH